MRQLVQTIVLSILIAVLGLRLVYAFVPVSLLVVSHDTVGNYLQTVGTIYAVLLAFVVFVVWTQFNEACAFIHREANDLRDLYRIVSVLPAPVATAAGAALREYTGAIIHTEWEIMQKDRVCRDLRECGRARDSLERIWQALSCFEPETARQQALYSEALTRFDDLSDARADRLRSAHTKIPDILWMLLLSGAGVMVCSMYLFSIRDFLLHGMMTAALAGALSHVLYVVYDLDNCFTGYWRVLPLPFQRVHEFMGQPA